MKWEWKIKYARAQRDRSFSVNLAAITSVVNLQSKVKLFIFL